MHIGQIIAFIMTDLSVGQNWGIYGLSKSQQAYYNQGLTKGRSKVSIKFQQENPTLAND